MALFDVPKQNRLVETVISGAWAKVHGHATAQLQLSNQSPVICQLEISSMSDRRRRGRSASGFTPNADDCRGNS
jgi:hypothetical protein